MQDAKSARAAEDHDQGITQVVEERRQQAEVDGLVAPPIITISLTKTDGQADGAVSSDAATSEVHPFRN